MVAPVVIVGMVWIPRTLLILMRGLLYNSTGLVPMGSASLGLRQSLEQGNCARHAAQAVGDWVWRRRSASPDARLRMLPCALLRVQPGDAESALSRTRSTGHASGDYVERRGDACKACLLVRCCQKPAIHGRKKLCKVCVFEKCHGASMLTCDLFIRL